MDSDNSGTIKPDENQSGIFSTGELKLETEHLPSEFGGGAAPVRPAASSPVSTPANTIAPTTRIESTVTEDLRIGEKKKRNKRPLIIGAIVLLVAALAAAFVIIVDPFNTGNAKVRDLLQENHEAASWVESFFVDTYNSKLDAGDVFTPELHDELNQKMSALVTLQSGLAEIRPSTLSSAIQQKFSSLRDLLSARMPIYQESVALYNSLYDAYTNKTPDTLSELMGSDNYYASVAAERFYLYLVNQQQIEADMKAHNCPGSDEACESILSAYLENIESLGSSTQVVSAIFTAYDDDSYDIDERFTPQVDALLKELK